MHVQCSSTPFLFAHVLCLFVKKMDASVHDLCIVGRAHYNLLLAVFLNLCDMCVLAINELVCSLGSRLCQQEFANSALLLLAKA